MDTYSKRNLWLVLLALFIFFFVLNLNAGSSEHRAAIFSQSTHLSTWQDEYILTYNNKKYTVTEQLTDEFDKVIGEVTYHGKPGFFKLYSIKNVEDYSKIAVETKEGYLIAILEK